MAKKPPVDEDAHFRIDELVRKLDELGEIGKSIPALIQGGVGVLQSSIKDEFEKKLTEIIQRQAEDVESDKALTAEIRELIKVLRTPVTRTCVINYPEGPVTMIVKDERE